MTASWTMMKNDVLPDIQSEEGVGALNETQNFFDSLPHLFIFILLGLALALFLTGWIIGSPAFFWIAFIPIILILVYVGPILANAYDTVIDDNAEIKNAESPIIRFVFAHFVDLIIILGVGYGVFLYGKSRAESGGFT